MPVHSTAAPISLLRLAPGPDGLGALHAAELPQKDNLCGCFWAALALRAAGVATATQDGVALEAGTALPEGDPATFVPPRELPRRDYSVQLPVLADAGSSGTSAVGLVRAVASLSDGRLAAVPVAGRWHAEAVVGVLEAVAEAAPDTLLVGNLRSGRLWGSRPPARLVLDHLAGRPVQAPRPDWDVGHFVNLAGLVRGDGGELVVVRDSYRSLGWDGHHLQPPAVLARALARGDGREGGVLCICRAESADAVHAALASCGYDVRLWDNGTPDLGPSGRR